MKNLNVFFYKIYFDIRSSFRYRMSILLDIFIMTVIYIFFVISGTGKSLSKTYNGNSSTLLLVGYIMWTISVSAISSLSSYLVSEASNGTLIYIIKSKTNIFIQLFSEMISSQIINIIEIIILIVISSIFLDIKIYVNLYTVFTVLLCIMGMFGLSLILAGISLHIKRMSGLIMLIQLLLLFVSDTIPTNNMILIFSKYLPLTLANNVLRRIISNMNYNNEFILLFIDSIIFLIIGLIIFSYLYNKAKEKDTLLLY